MNCLWQVRHYRNFFFAWSVYLGPVLCELCTGEAVGPLTSYCIAEDMMELWIWECVAVPAVLSVPAAASLSLSEAAFHTGAGSSKDQRCVPFLITLQKHLQNDCLTTWCSLATWNIFVASCMNYKDIKVTFMRVTADVTGMLSLPKNVRYNWWEIRQIRGQQRQIWGHYQKVIPDI